MKLIWLAMVQDSSLIGLFWTFKKPFKISIECKWDNILWDTERPQGAKYNNIATYD